MSVDQTMLNSAHEAALLRCLLQAQLRRVSDKVASQQFQSSTLEARATYLLLDQNRLGCDVETFLVYYLPRILGSPMSTTRHVVRERDGVVRGTVLWPATQRLRMAQPNAGLRLVTSEREEDPNIPVNQLLRHVIEALDQCLRLVPPSIWDGWCYVADTEHGRPARERLHRIAEDLLQAREQPLLMRCDQPETLDQQAVYEAEQSERPEYAQLASVARMWQRVVEDMDDQALLEIGRRVTILPGAPQGNSFWFDLAAVALAGEKGYA